MKTELSLSAAPPMTRLQQAALPMLFLLLGVIYATWAARIPAVRDALHLSAGELGLVLLCGGIGAVASFPLAAWLVGHFGARRATWYAGIALLLVMPGIALAPHIALLMLMVGGLGASISCFDVAINSLGAEAEKVAQRSIMSMLHAWFCLGTFSGALLGSAIAGMAISPLLHFSGIALLLAIPLWFGYQTLPNDRPDYSADKKHFVLPRGPLLALGIIAFCGAIVEGSLAGWSGVFMKDQLGASDGMAPLAYAVFAATMLAARLVCDRLKECYGARRVVMLGSVLGAIGIFLAVLAPSATIAIPAFGLTGAGVAAIFPFVFSAAGRHGSTALAGVATMGYSGNLIGPPVIGFLAQGWGLQTAVAFIGVLSIVLALAAGRAKWLV